MARYIMTWHLVLVWILIGCDWELGGAEAELNAPSMKSKRSTSQAFKLMTLLGVSNDVLGDLDVFYFGQSFSTKKSHHSLIGPEIFKAMAGCSWTRGRVSAIWADQKFTKQLRSYITYVTLPRWRLHAGLQDLGIQNHFAWIRFVCRVVWSASKCVDLWKIGRDTRRL